MTHREAPPERKIKRPRPKEIDFSPDDLYIDEPKKREKYLQLKRAFMKAHVLDMLNWSEESGDEPSIQISALTNAVLNDAASTVDVSSPDAQGNKTREKTRLKSHRASPTPPTDGTPYRIVHITPGRSRFARKNGSASNFESSDEKDPSPKANNPENFITPAPKPHPVKNSEEDLGSSVTSSGRRVPVTGAGQARADLASQQPICHKMLQEKIERGLSPRERIAQMVAEMTQKQAENEACWKEKRERGEREAEKTAALKRQMTERSALRRQERERAEREGEEAEAEAAVQRQNAMIEAYIRREQEKEEREKERAEAVRRQEIVEIRPQKAAILETLAYNARLRQQMDEREESFRQKEQEEREERETVKRQMAEKEARKSALAQQTAENARLIQEMHEEIAFLRSDIDPLAQSHVVTTSAASSYHVDAPAGRIPPQPRPTRVTRASPNGTVNAATSPGRPSPEPRIVRVSAAKINASTFRAARTSPDNTDNATTSSGRPSPEPRIARVSETRKSNTGTVRAARPSPKNTATAAPSPGRPSSEPRTAKISAENRNTTNNTATSSCVYSPEPSFLIEMRALCDRLEKAKAASPVDTDKHTGTEPSRAARRPDMPLEKLTSTDRYMKYGSSTIGRTRGVEEVGTAVHGSSLRVSRVGKVAGSFLSGPARRGRKKQHEDEQSPDAGIVSARVVEVAPVEERQAPPPPPAPAPITITAVADENEPPPTFKRAKPSSFALLDKVNHGAINEERVLAERGINAPNRSAPAPPLPPPKMSVLDTATAGARVATASHPRKRRNQINLNGKTFTKLDCIGKGGSSRVYRVMAENHKMFALKKVSLEDENEENIQGFKGEIDLLKKLDSVDRVVRLYDYEINDQKKSLSVLMEMGELDLASIISRRLNLEGAKFDPSFTRHYWKEMVECVEAIHQHGVVHSDLKPANFLLAQGRLKLIDFGIADAINDNTVNLHRNQHVGTPNYMSPESIVDFNAKSGALSGPRMMKLGKPSDIWSLGVILYQMVYGKCPFSHITNQYKKITAIPNPEHIIYFAPNGVGGAPVPLSLINTMKMCLQRDQSLRPTAKELLDEGDPFLFPDRERDDILQINQATLGRIITNVVNHCSRNGIPTGEQLTTWPAGFFGKIKQVQRDERAAKEKAELRQWHVYKWGPL